MAALPQITHSRNSQFAETSFSEKPPSSNLPMPQDQASSSASLSGRVTEVKELPLAAAKGCLATITDILTNHFGDVELSAIRDALHKAAGKGHEKIVHYLLTTFPHLFPQLDHEKALQKLKEVEFEKANPPKPDRSDCVLM